MAAKFLVIVQNKRSSELFTEVEQFISKRTLHPRINTGICCQFYVVLPWVIYVALLLQIDYSLA